MYECKLLCDEAYILVVLGHCCDAGALARCLVPGNTIVENVWSCFFPECAAPHKDPSASKSVFGQLFRQVQAIPMSALRSNEHAWTVVFAGEGANDAGYEIAFPPLSFSLSVFFFCRPLEPRDGV